MKIEDLKPGMKVRVKDLNTLTRLCSDVMDDGNLLFVDVFFPTTMFCYCDKVFTIRNIRENCIFLDDAPRYYFLCSWLDLVLDVDEKDVDNGKASVMMGSRDISVDKIELVSFSSTDLSDLAIDYTDRVVCNTTEKGETEKLVDAFTESLGVRIVPYASIDGMFGYWYTLN